MYAEHSAVELGVVTIHRSSFSLEHRMREADVGSQSADTIKLDFSSCLGRKQKTRQREPAGP